MGRGPQVVPSIRAMAAAAFMPLSRRLRPFRLPLQPPSTSMDSLVWASFRTMLGCWDQVPTLGKLNDLLIAKYPLFFKSTWLDPAMVSFTK